MFGGLCFLGLLLGNNRALLSNQQLCNSDPIKQLNWIKMIFFPAWMLLFWEMVIVLNSSGLQ